MSMMKCISKKSMERAVEILQDDGRKKRKREEDEEEKKYRQIDSQCKVVHTRRRKRHQQQTSFSKNLVLAEMRSHISRRDWRQTRDLFPSLLRRTTELEPLIWRYAFIVSLYSTGDNLSSIRQFLEMCVGSRPEDVSTILRNLLHLSAENR